MATPILSASRKIQVAKIDLRFTHPFFGVLVSHLAIQEAPEKLRSQVTTASVSRNGGCLYNPDFIDTLTVREVMGLLAHESLHPAFRIWDRIPNGNHELKNIAHDYVINLIIDKESKISTSNAKPSLKLPSGGLLDYDYSGMSFEAVYKALFDQCPELPQELSDCASGELESEIDTICGTTSVVSEHDEDADKAVETKWRKVLYEASEADRKESNGRTMGNLPDSLKLEVNAYAKPPLPYKKLIKKAFSQCGRKAIPSYHKRNKLNSFCPNSGFFAGVRSYGAKCYVLVDTSGSIFTENNVQLRSALSMVKEMANNMGMQITVVQCDTEVKWTGTHRDFMKNGKAVVNGGGGSDFKPAFDWIADDAKGIVGICPIFSFTDGLIVVHEDNPTKKMPTYWVTAQNEKPPTDKWGKHIPINKVA